jgi:hypothetical protein
MRAQSDSCLFIIPEARGRWRRWWWWSRLGKGKSVNEIEGCKARHLLDLMETISNAALLFVHRCLPLASPSPNHSRPVAAVKLVSHAFNISLSSPRRFHAPCDIDHQLTLASRSCTTTIHHSCCTTPDPPHRITRKQQLIPAFPALSH